MKMPFCAKTFCTAASLRFLHLKVDFLFETLIFHNFLWQQQERRVLRKSKQPFKDTAVTPGGQHSPPAIDTPDTTGHTPRVLLWPITV